MAAVIAVFFVGASVGQRSDGIGDLPGEVFGDSNDAELTSEALDVIDESYFREVDQEQLEDASVKGIVDDLRKRYKDRFSHYFTPDAVRRVPDARDRPLLGRRADRERGQAGSAHRRRCSATRPAKEAGIQEGDIVTEVDGKSIAGKDAELATGQIKGKPGTQVTLTVFRPSTKQTQDYKLERRELIVPAVESKLRQAGGRDVGYVRLLAFSRGAHAELRDAVDKLTERGAEGFVIDLRGNGGGLLDEAVLTSSVFVEDGVVVSTNGRTQPDKTFEARRRRRRAAAHRGPDQRRLSFGFGDLHLRARRRGRGACRRREVVRQGRLPGGDRAR